MEKKNTFAKTIINADNTTTTDNGHICYKSTLNKCLDLFGRAGSLRDCDTKEKVSLIKDAYNEDPDTAMKILFFIRDIRGGYGERDTFIDMAKWVADNNPESIKKNLDGFMEYGRAKDLYALVGTKAENDMWTHMKKIWYADLKLMKENKPVSLLAKWIATPDASSPNTKKLGKLTQYKLGYNEKKSSLYRKKLRALRKYINITEALMSANDWDKINYEEVASQCMLKSSKAFLRNDGERFTQFKDNCKDGTAKINTNTVTPCQIIRDLRNDNITSDMADTIWNNLPDYCTSDAFVMADVSGSMTNSSSSMKPIDVSIALAIYFAERNKGDLKNYFMTFSEKPTIVKVNSEDELYNKVETVYDSEWGFSTNLESAFDKLLELSLENKLESDDMPKAFIVISDMQINAASDEYENGKMKFFKRMKKKYAENGYKIPHIIFWNVNSCRATFHVAASDRGATLVSGYSPAIFKSIMNCIGKTPMESMMEVIGTDRYSSIKA